MTEQITRQEALEEKRRYWKQHIDNWQASGISQTEYCRQHQLLHHRFVYWKKKFYQSAPTSSFIELNLPPVHYPAGPPSVSSLRVAVNRFQVAVDRDFDPLTLRQLIYTLETI